MPATLQQIQAKLAEAIALRDELAETCATLGIEAAASGAGVSKATQQSLLAKLNGYHREVEALMKCERDLIAHGRLDAEAAQLAESRFNASQPEIAVLTPPQHSDAELAHREPPRSEASAPPLPASGDVF